MLFKKSLPAGRSNLLGNKDRKKLRDLMLKCFPGCSESQADEIVPKDEETTVMKIQGTRVQVYFSNKVPVLFDPNSLGDLFPTIYILLKYPDLLPSFLIPGPVSNFVIGGADLMVPGIVKPASTECYGTNGLLVNKRMAVRVYGNPIPLAVGRCTITNTEFVISGRGKALKILHTYGDGLWNLGSKIVPNLGFGAKSVAPLEPPYEENVEFYTAGNVLAMTDFVIDRKHSSDDGWGFHSDADINSNDEYLLDSEEEDADIPTFPIAVNFSSKITDNNVSANVNAGAKSDICDDEPDKTDVPVDDTSRDDRTTANLEDTGVVSSEAIPAEDEIASNDFPATTVIPTTKLPAPVIDFLLEIALLEVLHNNFSDASCPVPICGLFSKILQSACYAQLHPTFRKRLCEDVDPAVADKIVAGLVHVQCDVKQSSHKKLTKFFQYYTKKKLLQTKDVRGEMFIVSLNKQSPIFTQFVPTTEKERKYATKIINPAAVRSSATPNQSSGTATSTSFSVFEFYLPNSKSQEIFADVIPEISGLYFTAEQCKKALSGYINKRLTLQETSNKVLLNDTLQLCVLSATERKDANEKGAAVWMDKADLFQKFVSNLSQYHAVCKGPYDPHDPELKIKRDKLQPIKIQVEKRSGRKAVTTIANIQSFEINEKALAEALQRTLASSAATFELTGAAKGKNKPLAVMVQGSFLREVHDLLVAQFGIPKRFIITC